MTTHVHIGYEWKNPRSYKAETIRGSVVLIRPLGRHWKADLGVRAERVSLLRHAAEGGGRRTRLSTLSGGLVQDSRDDIDQPTRGAYLRLFEEWASPWLGSKRLFNRSEVQARRYLPAGPFVLALRTDWGWLKPQAANQEIPVSERYFLAGTTTLRGFPEESIGPTDHDGRPTGGRISALGSVEVRFPLWRVLGGSVFLDAGQLVNQLQALAPRWASAGAGVGLRVVSPVGRLRVDLGFPLTDRQAEGAQIYLRTGVAF